MMSEAATGTAPANNGAVQVPPPGSDEAKYADLRKELGLESTEQQEQQEAETVDKAIGALHDQRKHEPVDDPAAKPKPAYEDLERNYSNVQEALRQERAAKKAAEEQMARFMRIVEDSRGKRDEPKKDEPKLPDVQEDPIGHFTGRIAQLEAQLKEAHQGTQQTAEQQQAYQQHQALWQTVARSEQDIRDPKNSSHKADYDEACEYLESQRIKQLDRMYPDASPYAAQFAQQHGYPSPQQLKLAILNQDRQSVAVQALQLGMSPAQFYYELAQDAGYQSKPAQQRAPNGQFKPAEVIETVKRGKAASISISGSTGGKKGAEDMAIADLSELFIEDPEAADRIWEEMRKAGKLG